MIRDSVVIYRNLYEALQGVSDKAYKRIMNAILQYSLDGIEPNLTGVEMAVFGLAKTQIDANNRKYENGKKGAEHGKKGGRPKSEKPQENPTETPNEPLNVKCKMINDKESMNIEKEDNNTCVRSYSDIMEEFGVSDIVKPVLWEFIKHCQLNGRTLLNDKLEGIITELDMRYRFKETEKADALQKAINGGWFDIKRCANG